MAEKTELIGKPNRELNCGAGFGKKREQERGERRIVQEMGALGRSVHKVMLQCDLWLSLGEAQAGAAVDEGGSS